MGITASVVLGGALAGAQVTKQWTTDRFDELERGTAEGVAIRNDGRLEAGPAVTPVATLTAGYVWSVADGGDGAVLAGVGGSTGGSAAVVRVDAKGAQTTVWTGKELGVQAVRRMRDGSVVWASSPEGKVYRMAAGGGEARVIFDPGTMPEKPRYLWDLAVDSDGAVYVAAGAPAAVYRIPAGGGAAELLFRTADQHIRSLLLRPDGVLWAGSDGAGVVYRFNTKGRGAKPFAAYAAGRREVTALASDGAGTIFLGAVGAKTPTTLPPLPVTGTVGITVTFVQPGSASAAGSNSVVPDGSEVDQIAPDGVPSRLLVLPNDVLYALQFRGGRVVAATGNRGRMYAVDPTAPGRGTEIARLEAGQATTMAAAANGILVGTSNGGRLARLGDGLATMPTFTSEVFDAGQYARWGRVSDEADAPGFRLETRTGNVPSPVEGWSEWRPVAADGTAAGLPDGRYAQWRAVMEKSGALDAVTMNFLPRNVPPVVDEVVVVPGARVQAGSANGQPATVQVVFPSAANATQAIALVQDTGTTPLTAQKDRTAVTVRWAAHDDNGDDLLFRVWYRGVGEANWRLLRDEVSERFVSFDSTALPDGRYEVKVEASDAPEHVAADTLTGERVSAAFTLDTTPPVPSGLAARMEGSRVHWTMEARDAVSPIEHAEFSVDGEPWQYAVPVGGLSDGLTERYDATVAVPRVPEAERGGVSRPGEHVLAVRVFDRPGNAATAKTVVR